MNNDKTTFDNTADNSANKAEAKKPWWKITGGKADDKKFGWVGATFRIVGYTMLFLAAVTALVMGMHYGIAFVAGLGLSALITNCLTYLIGLVAYLTAVFVGWKISGWINGTIDTASKNTINKESAGPKPAAA